MATAGERPSIHPGAGPPPSPGARSLPWPHQPLAWGLSSATAPITAERRKGGPGSTGLSHTEKSTAVIIVTLHPKLTIPLL